MRNFSLFLRRIKTTRLYIKFREFLKESETTSMLEKSYNQLDKMQNIDALKSYTTATKTRTIY